MTGCLVKLFIYFNGLQLIIYKKTSLYFEDYKVKARFKCIVIKLFLLFTLKLQGFNVDYNLTYGISNH